MSTAVNTIRCSLLLLGLVGIYTVWISSFRNGLFLRNEEFAGKGQLPGTPNATLRTHFTGIDTLDKALGIFVVFYWPVCQGNLRSLSLIAFPAAVGVGEMWILFALQFSQSNSPTRAMGKMAMFGMGLMLVGPGIFLPIYCSLDLSSTHRLDDSPSSAAEGHLCRNLRSCLLGGYYILVILLALPSPAVVSYGSKQGIIALLQGWPLLVSAMLWLTHLCGKDRTADFQATLSTARTSIYISAMACATISHLVPLLISLLADSSDICPGKVFVPHLAWPSRRVTSVEEGLLRFFQWDYGLGSLALLLWAVGLHIQRRQQISQGINYLRLIPEALFLSVMMSPCGAAALYLYRHNSTNCASKTGDKSGSG
ncbi:hypothetical protein PENPOL_c002G01858 [Penicillium polonicum]|uniref:Terpene cyclase verU1 n=1 Tax=Penicillium polonicum TaxID=60169 RepID=VERU1_PENPO|nr:RecName: Full=Terpene cyclase verU1; AltName: Full=Cluster 4 protein U1; AltName: Full=Verrucosidin biosynthesis cluster protein U1 [Penicillium polonicum]OQD69720.1 hypothetical protein PENPOL_c002G01858 [Penicillium polonicum]